MPEAVIVATARTPVGRARKGSLVDVRPDDLLAFAIRSALDKVPELDAAEVVDVITGCAGQEGKQGGNIARRAALLAGLPETVPGTTVNRFCASSLQTIRMAFHAVGMGEGDVFIASGVECVSQYSGAARDPDTLHPRLTGRGNGQIADVYISMGMTAENVAERYGVKRDDMDRFAQRSQERAVASQGDGFFEAEITPYPKADGTVVGRVDGPRAGMTIQDVDVMELNEAFASQGLAVCEAVGMDAFSDRFNPHGGAIALGHPFGMTGARIMTTLLNGLETSGGTIGLETMCVGGGQGMALGGERLN